MVPNGWKKGLLDEGIELISGQHVEANCVNNLGVGIPYLTGPADFPNGKIVVTKFTNEGKKFSKKGDLLITVKGSGTGKVIESDNEYAISRQLMAIRPKTFDSKFVYYNLVSSLGRYEDAAAGLIPGISREDVLHTPLLIPPIDEQMAIAQILSNWDQAISATEKLLENSQQQKKALMQQLLTGKKRLLDENGQFFNSEWLNLAVNQIGRVVTGSTPPKDQVENYGGEFGWATAEDFKGKYINDTKIQLSEIGMRKARLLSKGAVLVTCIASIGKNAIANKEMATNQQINAVEINEFNSNEFFYYLIEFSADKLRALAGTTAVAILNKSTFEKIKFQMPPLQEQRKIAQVISIADQEIETLQKKFDCLKQEKKALMQQLLTGKKRVKVAA